MAQMRDEKEMMRLILGTAESDERIRAVVMNGSRANPNVKKDKYRDYDIIYIVRETASFLADKEWVKVFGEKAIIQEPDSNDLGWGIDADFTKSYTWLMLFRDGNRIDLQIQTPESYFARKSDSLTVTLLDKDGILPAYPESNEEGYYIEKPTREKYAGCCNEFWWCLNNVAKGIVRKQLPYALRMYLEVVHSMVDRMTDWYIASEHDYSVSVGKFGKYYEKYLSPELFRKYCAGFPEADYESLKRAISESTEYFSHVAREVASRTGYRYNEDDEAGALEYLKMMYEEMA